MKFRIIFIAMALVCLTRVALVQANDTTSFTENLKDCREYYGSQTIDLQDIKLTTTRQIQGWVDGKCSYKEAVSTKDAKYTVNCLLSKENIADLVKTMEDFEKDESNKNIDLNDFSQVQSSTIVSNWSKYLQNPEICSIEMQ